LPPGSAACLLIADCAAGSCVSLGPPHLPAVRCTVPACATNADCQADGSADICMTVGTGCAGPAHCAPPCSVSQCALDEQCGSDGQCRPTPCDQGYACSAGTLCAPTRAAVDVHGCAAASCVDDGYVCPTSTVCDPMAGGLLDAHGCKTLSCQAGGSCAANSRCDPAHANGSADDCAPLSCAVNADCDCGACLHGQCVSQPGYCG
jgi:hypothetical protein